MIRRESGFSLFELTCALAVISILTYTGSMKVFGLSQIMEDQRLLNEDIQRLEDALLKARHLAIHSGQSSYLCGGIACNGDWSSGFRLYQLEESSNRYQVMSFHSGVQVIWQGFPAQKQQIEFQANGLSGYQNGTFSFCLGEWHANLVLNQSGRYYTSDLVRGSNLCV